ncbi:hypothetical protein AC578_10203 [Pseudocercospora eumusae]|uniref:Uncharacterized protein n=1 Tax=Pseudocercospora eumusae TaxID=321146 RepID=A0A139HZ86_9PEZI|nr:hypothetical protein AC578_10203 [Pseudocercospora eumusae]
MDNKRERSNGDPANLPDIIYHQSTRDLGPTNLNSLLGEVEKRSIGIQELTQMLGLALLEKLFCTSAEGW